MKKTILIFLSVLAFSFFYSCKTETSNQDLEATAVTSETGSGTQSDKAFAVKDASYVIHYKQKVLKNSDDESYVTSTSDGFEQAEAEDKSANPVKALTQLKTLAKNYEGFSYSYAIQKASTIYIYYTRNTVEYSFYKDANTLGGKIRGVYGLACTPPDILIGNNVVISWKSELNGSGNGLTNEFGPVNASFYANKTGTGTKHKPTAAGDIVFYDGTAATTAEIASFTDEMKRKGCAVIIFDHYNTYSDSPYDGKVLVGVGLRAVNLDHLKERKWRDKEPQDGVKTFVCNTNYGYYDFQILKQLYESLKDNLYDYWSAFYWASSYFEEYFPAEDNPPMHYGWYLPSWKELSYTLAGNYKYYKILKDACYVLGISTDDFDNKDFWATPNQRINTGTDAAPVYNFYTAYVTGGKNWKELTFEKDKPSSDVWANQWKDEKGENNKCTILPFRAFK